MNMGITPKVVKTEWKCSNCDIVKPISNFRLQRNGYYDTWCRPCCAKWQSNWRKTHREQHNAAKKRYKERHPEYAQKCIDRAKRWYEQNREHVKQRSRAWRLKDEFGITASEYDELLQKQNGVCAICRKENNRKGQRLHVDHEHTLGKVRGLLCNNCNLGLGYLQDSPDILLVASEYVRNHGKG